jgi:hypothetical protein
MQSDPKSQFPPYDEKNKEVWMKARDAYFEAFNKRITEHMEQAASVLRNKTGQARAVTINELLQSQVPLDGVTKAQLRQMLVASWDSLPARVRNQLVQYRWEEIGGPELLPILRRIVAGEANPNRQIDKPDRGSALRRIYELDPQEGRQLILREIAHPRGDIGIHVLGMLPERELPQIEQPIVEKLKVNNGTEGDFQLIQRYASGRALPDIRAIYETHRGEWACAPQAAMLRYFLRVSPDYGVARVSDALTQRNATGCYSMQLSALEEDVRQPKIQRVAIRALNDASSQVARDAAQALQKYGRATAETALWARLEKFHEKWKGHAEELHVRPGATQDFLAEIGLEQALVQAITTAQGWFADEQSIQRLKELTTRQMQQQLDDT